MVVDTVTITRAGPQDVPDLVRLMRAIAAEEQPHDPAAPATAEEGAGRALQAGRVLERDDVWVLLAWVGGVPAGYALACRIPKLDPRLGFLFVDELYVLQPYRRRGVATALMRRIQALAGELGLAGVRLLVRPENVAARRLYRRLGFVEHATYFCEWRAPVEGGISDDSR